MSSHDFLMMTITTCWCVLMDRTALNISFFEISKIRQKLFWLKHIIFISFYWITNFARNSALKAH